MAMTMPVMMMMMMTLIMIIYYLVLSFIISNTNYLPRQGIYRPNRALPLTCPSSHCQFFQHSFLCPVALAREVVFGNVLKRIVMVCIEHFIISIIMITVHVIFGTRKN